MAFIGSLLYLGYFYVVTLGSLDADPASRAEAVVINLALFTTFALHHSLLARWRAKRLVARLLGERFERSAYVWAASVLVMAMCALWQPVPGLLYAVEG